ncbi:hypothetical protein [Synechococcus sp. M16CYN]|uniref:hypothetical protein n=1 Tax=Synechococcus sp. M16CYN TaxID=3103139 RepID=UPI00334169C7
MRADGASGTEHADGFHAVPVIPNSLPLDRLITGKLAHSFESSTYDGNQGVLAL